MADLWYLSPSSQYGNLGVNGYGSEGEQMNLLMDQIISHLDRHGVDFHRAQPRATIEEKCAEADELGAEWYLALHSNAGGNGQAVGAVAFYRDGTRELAQNLVQELRNAGQQSNRAQPVAQGEHLYEVRTPRGKSCLLEVDFHDAPAGVEFLTTRRGDAARAIAKAIVQADGKTWAEASPSGEEDGASTWAKPFAEKAKALGLFSGDGKGYRLQEPITREELAVVLIRLKELLE